MGSRPIIRCPRKIKDGRRMNWTVDHTFEGWTCSECAWMYPVVKGVPVAIGPGIPRNGGRPSRRILDQNGSLHSVKAV